MALNMLPTAVAVGAGGVDGWLARQDAITAARQIDQTKQHSLWFEVIAAGGGLVLNSRARTQRTQDIAQALLYTGAALLGRRAGVMLEQRSQEANILGGAVTALPGGYAAPAVFAPVRMGASAQALSPGNVRATRGMNASI